MSSTELLQFCEICGAVTCALYEGTSRVDVLQKLIVVGDGGFGPAARAAILAAMDEMTLATYKSSRPLTGRKRFTNRVLHFVSAKIDDKTVIAVAFYADSRTSAELVKDFVRAVDRLKQ